MIEVTIKNEDKRNSIQVRIRELDSYGLWTMREKVIQVDPMRGITETIDHRHDIIITEG